MSRSIAAALVSQSHSRRSDSALMDRHDFWLIEAAAADFLEEEDTVNIGFSDTSYSENHLK